MAHLSRKDAHPLIVRALREDAADADATSRAVIPSDARARARIVAKARGILVGGPLAAWTFQAVDPSLRCQLIRRDGSLLARGDTILTVEGRARSILAAERTALNFLGHLSGVATLTQAFKRRVRPHRVAILDTRKTLPGLRTLEQYAVRVGGGQSHRRNLAEAILIKTNHLRALGTARGSGRGAGGRGRFIRDAVARARRARPKRFVQVEVTTVGELKAALAAQPDAILLDNMTLKAVRKAVALRNASAVTGHRPRLEVSGGITLVNVRAIARTGVERISIGRLTHSAPALDVSLQVVSARWTASNW
jgi:nicotinate-nucleotide pyrophosphorylase (carboxylating)